MKMTTFWQNERNKLLGKPLIPDDNSQSNTAIDAPIWAVQQQSALDIILAAKQYIGILEGFYVGAINQQNYNIALNDLRELIPPNDRLRLNLVFEPRQELAFLSKVRLVSADSQIPGQIIVADYTPTSNDDNGIWLVYNLCQSKHGYLFQINKYAHDVFLKEAISDAPIKGDSARSFKIYDLENRGDNGASNLSTTKRTLSERTERLRYNSSLRKPLAADEYELFDKDKKNPNKIFGIFEGRASKLEKLVTLFDGISTLHPTAKWDEQDAQGNIVAKPRVATVFHELWEIWERTDNHYPYSYPKFDEFGNAIGSNSTVTGQAEDTSAGSLLVGAHL